jgi:Ca2+-binding EF-hand superfamily protein
MVASKSSESKAERQRAAERDREARQAFDAHDANGDGVLTHKEMKAACRALASDANLKSHLDAKEINWAFDTADRDHNDKVDFEEFRQIYGTIIDYIMKKRSHEIKPEAPLSEEELRLGRQAVAYHQPREQTRKGAKVRQSLEDALAPSPIAEPGAQEGRSSFAAAPATSDQQGDLSPEQSFSSFRCAKRPEVLALQRKCPHFTELERKRLSDRFMDAVAGHRLGDHRATTNRRPTVLHKSVTRKFTVPKFARDKVGPYSASHSASATTETSDAQVGRIDVQGHIDSARMMLPEFRKFCSSFSVNSKPLQEGLFNAMCRLGSADGSSLTYQELLRLLCPGIKGDREQRAAFMFVVYDCNGSGQISVSELYKPLRDCEPNSQLEQEILCLISMKMGSVGWNDVANLIQPQKKRQKMWKGIKHTVVGWRFQRASLVQKLRFEEYFSYMNDRDLFSPFQL